MKLKKVCWLLQFLLFCLAGHGQYVTHSSRTVLDEVEQFLLDNEIDQAISILDSSISSIRSSDDLAYLYAYQSSLYTSKDSLLLGKQLLDLSLEHAEKSQKGTSKAIAFRAKAYLNNIMNEPDAVVADALQGLKFVEGNEDDLATKYHLNYLLYGAYSKWDDGEKMEKYIRICQRYAMLANNINLQTNANNGISSMYLARYKKSGDRNVLDSSYYYLNKAFTSYQQFPEKVSGNTSVITCINLANYYLEYSTEDIRARKQQAFEYLGLAEKMLQHNKARSELWINVFGIKSGFAKKEGELALAEQYLTQGLDHLMGSSGNHFRLEYVVNKDLIDIALKKNDLKAAISYQQKAERLLKKSFDAQQIFHAQKLEVQYEIEKKDQQLKLLGEREVFRKKQNYLYGGIAGALLFGLVFLFASYHFRLRYAAERESKLKQEKEDAEHQVALRLQIEKEEQARLQAEQELLHLKRQQLEKEALANSLIIEHKNDMLQQIQGMIRDGDAADIQKLLKEELLLRADFEDVKLQIQELHPGFFSQLSDSATQKLTSLDFKYCAYIFLQMTTKQIAQVLHVEPQSVRMFKYRLKQKLGLGKNQDLEEFLRSFTP